MLQQHGAHLLTWLLSLGRTPEPSRVPQPVRPDAPSRPHMPHRGSLIPRVRNRRWQSRRAALQGHSGNRNPLRSAAPSQTTPPHGAMQRGRRRRGKSGGPPRPRDQIRPPQGPVSACKLPGKLVRAALNLFHSAQTKSCLGHCITRGIGLRRQATILRLRGAVLFSRAEARPAREFGRARGVETLIARRFLPCLCAAQVFVQHGTMKLCGSTPVIAEECGRHGLPRWPCAASS